MNCPFCDRKLISTHCNEDDHYYEQPPVKNPGNGYYRLDFKYKYENYSIMMSNKLTCVYKDFNKILNFNGYIKPRPFLIAAKNIDKLFEQLNKLLLLS